MSKNIQTNFSLKPLETDQTDQTVKISNDDFLAVLFDGDLQDRCPILVSFQENPAHALKQAWWGHPWKDAPMVPLGNANNYFTLACFVPNEKGEYRRKKSQFKSLHAIMLDDVGTKVPMERLTLRPSWLLETSLGNYQAGYILTDPITDADTADQLMNAIVNAGLCDPGANGPTTRLARLPVAINSKHDPVFSCQLRIWEPANRYSVQELVSQLQLILAEEKPKQRKRFIDRTANEDDNQQIWYPMPKENAVVVAVQNRNLYKSSLGEGKHDITCPWVMEHTNYQDGGTVYFEPDDNYPNGGFKCQHGHCSNPNISSKKW